MSKILDNKVLNYLNESVDLLAIQGQSNSEIKGLYESLDELNYNPVFNEEMIPVIKDEDKYFVEFSDVLRVMECYSDLQGVCSESLAISKICKHYSIQESDLIVILPSQKEFESYLESLSVYKESDDDDDDEDDEEHDDDDDEDDDDDDEECIELDEKCKKEGCKSSKTAKKAMKKKLVEAAISNLKSLGIVIVKKKN